MSTSDKITKLKGLLDSGAITSDEYEYLKQEIMAEVDSGDCATKTTATNNNPLAAQKTVSKSNNIICKLNRMYEKSPYGTIFGSMAVIALLVLLVGYSFGWFYVVKLSGTTWIGRPAVVRVDEEVPKKEIEFYENFFIPGRGKGFWEGKGEFEWTLSLERFNDANKLIIRFENTSEQSVYYVKYDMKDSNTLCLYSKTVGVGPTYYLNLQ